ncbi:hypothetical protein ALC56_09953, partial [Trachymyrmex septentrionalis]
ELEHKATKGIAKRLPEVSNDPYADITLRARHSARLRSLNWSLTQQSRDDKWARLLESEESFVARLKALQDILMEETEIHLKYTRRNASLDNFLCNEVSSRSLSSRAFERVKQFVEHEPLSVFFSSHSDDHICNRFITLVL